MENEIRDLFDDELRAAIEELKYLRKDTKAYSDAVDTVARMYKIRTEEIAADRAFMAKSDETLDRERDYEIRKEQLQSERISRRWKLGADLAGIIVPAAIYALCFFRGLKYEGEEEGIYTSHTLKSVIPKLKIR